MSHKLIAGSLATIAAAGGLFLATASAQAAMTPFAAPQYSISNVQPVFCAIGAHIGPLGACIGGPGYIAPRAGYYAHPAYRHCWINRWGNRVCN
jgi:hypothetical protein